MKKEIKRTPYQPKKSGNPSEPDRRTNASEPTEQRKQDNIIHEFLSICKRANKKQRLLLPFVTIAGLLMYAWDKFAELFVRMNWKGRTAVILLPVIVGLAFTACTNEEAPAPEQEIEAVFADDNGTAVDMQAIADAWAAEAGMEKRYNLTDSERWEIASTITAEAVGEPFAGKVAVAQCILQTCEDEKLRPFAVLKKYNYSKYRPEPCEEALEAVQAVFDFGHIATAEPIKYFYAPARVHSSWHESQDYVMTINGHKFFKEAE